MFKFEITSQLAQTAQVDSGEARTGVITTAHGQFETPAFMPVGTLGALKGLTPAQLLECGTEILLMNAFHLAWRPGEKRVEALGELHKFTSWNRPILTDSGGFQVFSLPGLRKISEEGASFASAIDGTVRMFTPETVMEIQNALAPDIAMPLDQCPALPCTDLEMEDAVERSIRWLKRGADKHKEIGKPNVNLYGIIQGGVSEKMRKRSTEGSCEIELPGYALGGFCVGEELQATHDIVAYATPLLPKDKPRYLMGMGTPLDILHAVAHGADQFDCTLPTRNGRNGMAFTSQGPLKLRNARYKEDQRPLDEDCTCYSCQNFSRAFLRHLFLARELNACILTTLHNIAFYQNLMKRIRETIRAGTFWDFKKAFEEKYKAGIQP